MQIKSAPNVRVLLDMVAAGSLDPSDPGPVVLRINLWDGRVIEARYCRDERKFHNPDAETMEDVFIDEIPLVPLVQKLLEDRTPFVTLTGTDDMVCCIEWVLV